MLLNEGVSICVKELSLEVYNLVFERSNHLARLLLLLLDHLPLHCVLLGTVMLLLLPLLHHLLRLGVLLLQQTVLLLKLIQNVILLLQLLLNVDQLRFNLLSRHQRVLQLLLQVMNLLVRLLLHPNDLVGHCAALRLPLDDVPLQIVNVSQRLNVLLLGVVGVVLGGQVSYCCCCWLKWGLCGWQWWRRTGFVDDLVTVHLLSGRCDAGLVLQ